MSKVDITKTGIPASARAEDISEITPTREKSSCPETFSATHPSALSRALAGASSAGQTRDLSPSVLPVKVNGLSGSTSEKSATLQTVNSNGRTSILMAVPHMLPSFLRMVSDSLHPGKDRSHDLNSASWTLCDGRYPCLRWRHSW